MNFVESLHEILHNFKCVSVYTFLSAYFATSVSEISKDFKETLTQKSSMDEQSKSLSECFLLVTK